MSKIIGFALTALLLTACSSTPENATDRRSEIIERYFVGGFIKVVIEEEQLNKIISQASAPVLGNSPNSKSAAAKVAEAKARVQIEKMRETFIDAEDNIQISTETSEQDNEGKVRVISETAESIVTNITQKINSVQRGVYVSNETFDPNTNTVIVTVESNSEIKKLLSQY